MRCHSFLFSVLLSLLFFTSACEFLNRPHDREISLEERLRQASEQGQRHADMSSYPQPVAQPGSTGGPTGSNGGFSGSSSDKLLSDGSTSCNTADDCVLVSVDCCGCSHGGGATAVHKSQKDDHNNALKARCWHPGACTAWYRCLEYEVLCQNSQCVAVEK